MSTPQPDPVDILAFAPHPDDAELCAGGLLLKARDAGQRVVVVDMTRGEAGTRGTPETRAAEAAAAAEMLGLVARENLELPDARVEVSPAAVEGATRAIRTWRPKVVLSPCREDRHPDHIVCAEIVRRAYYGATIEKGPGGPHPAHRPDVLMQYFGHLEPPPSFIVDISDVWDERLELARCFHSQISNEEGTPKTNIGSPDFEHRVSARFAYWGSRIGARYGEPYLVDRLLPVDDPVAVFRKRGWAVL
jgi:bacillithiol biosynthesis deacetylase BshB1